MSSSLSLSTSLSSPSLRNSPFSVLPPELTQLIIEHTVPPSFQTSTYKSRQSTLRSLCLVSKSFHHFAKPLLLATVWIEPFSNYEGWKEIHARGDVKLLCRELIFDQTMEKLLLDVDLAGYAGLRTLVISGSPTAFDLSDIDHLSHLTVLRFINIAVSASVPFSLPNLHEMSLCQMSSVTDQARILNPSTLPSLRFLTCFEERSHQSGNFKGLELLVPQLHAVALDYDLLKSVTPELRKKLDPITLFDAEIGDLDQAIPISHLRVYDSFGYLENYANLAHRLSQAQLSLPFTIFLPLSASPAAADVDNNGGERSHLLEVCTGRGIEVVYEDIPDLWWLDSAFSEHFLERMKEERREEEGKLRK